MGNALAFATNDTRGLQSIKASEDDRGQTLANNAQIDADRLAANAAINNQILVELEAEKAERQRLQSCAAQHIADNCPVFAAFADSAFDEFLSDEEIIELLATTFGLSPLETIDRLRAIDFAAVVRVYLKGAA